MSRKNMVFMFLGITVVAVLGIAAFYWIEGTLYVTTDDARVASNVVAVIPEIPGKIVEWRVKEGDRLSLGDPLGRQDLGSALTSGALNPQGLGSVAGIFAEKAVIKAPISGQVIQSSAVVGQMAGPQTTLAIIADTEGLYVSANIKEGHIGGVKVGQDVDVRIDAFPRKIFKGKVESIGRATASTFSLLPTQSGGGNYTKVVQVIPIKITLVDRGSERLMIGMNAYIRIRLTK